jgi:hypothetical protein
MNGVEGGVQPLRPLRGLVIGPEVDEERAGLVVEHVIVDRRDFDPAVAQRLDERVDLDRRN